MSTTGHSTPNNRHTKNGVETLSVWLLREAKDTNNGQKRTDNGTDLPSAMTVKYGIRLASNREFDSRREGA